MYSDILYPTDGSRGSIAALEHVRDLAERYDATVHVLSVLDTTHPALGLGDDPDKEAVPGMVGHPEGGDEGMIGRRETAGELHEREQGRAETIVEEVASRLESVDTRTAVQEGTPHEVILEYADDVDMIVMGTHGYTGFERYMLGSVAEKVVRMADVPVVTVRAPAESSS
ncbi:universal stress protein [Halapricum hydrolyticum]|uniref:Universal stress protein n=1 Tax=Halapricum hydrolyticum TaxID=2979991 RepID=A0AAE3IA70_9EURY|nr:universal stress protein [Halapricum hydrolyticum]MCU4717038.1 universal stress protein [Halapricum hydrolyticum]MCU4725964.1 universal stress protein [Halapricum hydrolyticum]